MPERSPDHPIASLFWQRWSPRAFDGQSMPEADLFSLLEAARWAPSAYNHQPWRFLYAQRGDAHWERFLSLLTPANARWAQHAAALVFVVSDTLIAPNAAQPLEPSRTHSFDAGAAWAQFALQATHMGYHAHAMAGVDFEAARAALAVPARFRIEIAIAVGRRTAPETLPEPQRRREYPSPRRPIRELAFAGRFPGEAQARPAGDTAVATPVLAAA